MKDYMKAQLEIKAESEEYTQYTKLKRNDQYEIFNTHLRQDKRGSASMAVSTMVGTGKIN